MSAMGLRAKITRAAAAVLVAASVLISCRPTSTEPDGPRLVVFVVVDQLRGDLLERYASVFTGGFRRLLDQGYDFKQASHRHALTETAPGHATLATGVYPARHGLPSNDWAELRDGRWVSVYSVADPNSPLVGQPGSPGRSPVNLLRSGLADWMIEADAGARVVSISVKDRAAVAMGGKGPSEVYWLGGNGAFVTSTYYSAELPEWVRRFNEHVMPTFYRDSVWVSNVPPAEAYRSRPDTTPFEGDGVHSFFPHRFRDEAIDTSRDALLAWTLGTPVIDDAVTALGIEAIDELRLGQRDHVDFLSLALSQTDFVGHAYGPLSREQMDNLLHLDVALGRLLDRLDSRVGRGRWVLALSGDHGVLNEPVWPPDQGEPVPRRSSPDLGRVRAAVIAAMSARAGSTESDRRAAVDALEALPFVGAAYLNSELEEGAAPDTLAVLFRNSLAPGRSSGPVGRYGIQVRLKEGTEWNLGRTGARHGSPYWYDRWVPLVFLGAGVRPGSSKTAVYTVDAAPTLASLARVGAPRDLDGRPLIP